jgi:hypothetical protein
MEDRFVDNGGGTVTDTCTGLTWLLATADIDNDGQITQDDKLTWQEALQYCAVLDFAGHTDWRLPNIRELHSIADYGRSGPAIDPVFSAEPSWYWSATSHAGAPESAWLVSSVSGYVLNENKMSHRDFVRAVRGGL